MASFLNSLQWLLHPYASVALPQTPPAVSAPPPQVNPLAMHQGNVPMPPAVTPQQPPQVQQTGAAPGSQASMFASGLGAVTAPMPAPMPQSGPGSQADMFTGGMGITPPSSMPQSTQQPPWLQGAEAAALGPNVTPPPGDTAPSLNPIQSAQAATMAAKAGAPSASTQPPAPPQQAVLQPQQPSQTPQGPGWQSWLPNIAQAESGGGAQVGNGGGALQFSASSIAAIRKQFPQLQNVPPTDPTFQKLGGNYIATQNISADPAAATDAGQFGASWMLGPADAKKLAGADPTANAAQILGPKSPEVQGNLGIFDGGKATVQEVLAKARAGALSGKYTVASSQAPSPQSSGGDPLLPTAPVSADSPQGTPPDYYQQAVDQLNKANAMLANPQAMANSVKPSFWQKLSAIGSGWASGNGLTGPASAGQGAANINNLVEHYQNYGLQAGQASAESRIRQAEMMMMMPYRQAQANLAAARTDGTQKAAGESYESWNKFSNAIPEANDTMRQTGQVLSLLQSNPSAVGPGLLPRLNQAFAQYGITFSGASPTGVQLTEQGIQAIRTSGILENVRGSGLRSNREFQQLSSEFATGRLTPDALKMLVQLSYNDAAADVRLHNDITNNPGLLKQITDPNNQYGGFDGYKAAYDNNYFKQTYGVDGDSSTPAAPMTTSPSGQVQAKQIAPAHTVQTKYGNVSISP